MKVPAVLVFTVVLITGCSALKGLFASDPKLKITVLKKNDKINNSVPIDVNIVIPTNDNEKEDLEKEECTANLWFQKTPLEKMNAGHWIIGIKVDPENPASSEPPYCMNGKLQGSSKYDRTIKAEELIDDDDNRTLIISLKGDVLASARKYGVFVWANYGYDKDQGRLGPGGINSHSDNENRHEELVIETGKRFSSCAGADVCEDLRYQALRQVRRRRGNLRSRQPVERDKARVSFAV